MQHWSSRSRDAVVPIQQASCKMWSGKRSRTLVRSMAWTYHHYGQLAVNLSPEFNVASIFYKEEKMTNWPSDHRHCILQVQRGGAAYSPSKCRSLDSNVKGDGGHFGRAIESRVNADCSYPSSRINLRVSNAIHTHVENFAHGRKDEGTYARKSDLSSVTVA